MWYVRECDKGGRVMMGVLRRRFCVDMIGGKGIFMFLVGLGYDTYVCRGKFSPVLLTCGGCVCNILLLSLAARCLRDNTCVYVAHVCLYVCCSDGAGVCGDVCGVSGVAKLMWVSCISRCEVLCI